MYRYSRPEKYVKYTVNLIIDFYKVLEYFRHLGPDWSGDPTGALHMYMFKTNRGSIFYVSTFTFKYLPVG